MVEKEAVNTQQFMAKDFNTRIRDLDERNKLLRERILLLGKNLLSSREETEEDLQKVRSENAAIKKELEQMKKVTSNLSFEFSKFVKKEELLLVERMLKDFQPLEFMRRKDVEELISAATDKISSKKGN